MGHQIEHPPGAAALSSSMRDIGYSLDTAIADLIDNSISACADTVINPAIKYISYAA